MGTYGLEGVLLAWKAETLTTEQAVGQILLLLQEMERRLAALERVVTWPATPASTPAPAVAMPPPAPATPPPPSAPGESAAPAPQPEKAEEQRAPVKSADPAPKHRRGKRHTRAGRRRKPPAA